MKADASRKRDRVFAALAAGPVLMGIVNVTPDSFSDGGRFQAPDAAAVEAGRHIEGGAGIIDLGAESTRPGFAPVSEAEERARLAPVLESLARLDVAVSIDTTKAGIAALALEAGAAIVNDQWGLQGDPAMADVVAASGAGLVVMHNRADIDADLDIVDDLRRFFDRSLTLAEAAGISHDRIILDPGIGFGKSKPQNLRALGAGVTALLAYRLPILIGVSRKSLFAALIGKTAVEDRLVGTLAANLSALERGARVFRVHDCAEHRDAFAVRQAISNGEWTAIGFGLGGNLGDAPATIREALRVLASRGHVRVGTVSSMYRTKPWGPVAQPDFANACALAETDLSPRALLDEVKAVEVLLGRETGERWGPRAIDIDILFYDGASLDTPDLVIPHESLFQRAFVLIPLAEIAPNLTIAGRRVADAARESDESAITPWTA